MKAAIYAGRGGPITIESIADPTPGPGEVLIKVQRCGICGTDLSMTKGEMWDYGPGQFGHEYAGEIVAMGAGVAGLKLGAKVAVLPSSRCGHCVGCNGGNPILCDNSVSIMAGFSEYALLPAQNAVVLPDALSLADGALVEPLAISLYGVRQSQLAPGARVLVLGGGTVALYAIYWARRLGAGRIVAASRSDRRRDLCLAMGADAFVTFGDGEIGEVIEALGGPPYVVYECVGVPGMVAKSVMHAKKYGKVVSLGFCTQPDPIMPSLASYKCVTVQFLVGYTLEDFRHVADQFDAGHIDPKSIVTNEIGLAALPDMFATLRGPNDETKVHVLM
jgi:threonine dehydrogenase-like Zn-dependent dehydrogenase